LLEQDFSKNDYEIVLVDDGSSDGGLEKIASFIQSSPVRTKIVMAGGRGCFRARNKGMEKAEGEIIAFIDSDEVADKNWLKNLVKLHFESSDVGGVVGNTITDNNEALILPFVVAPIGATGLRNGVVKTGTCNVAYRRSILLDIGGFDEAFDPMWRGDSDLGLTVQENGFKIVYEPEAVVYHPLRTHSVRDIWKEGFKRHHDALLYSKHSKNKSIQQHLGDGITKPFGRFSPLSILILTGLLVVAYLAIVNLLLLCYVVLFSYAVWLLFFLVGGYRFVSKGAKPGFSLRFKAAVVLPFYFFSVFLGRSYGCIKYRTLLL
jgi:GT2 family glycosyltransferase